MKNKFKKYKILKRFINMFLLYKKLLCISIILMFVYSSISAIAPRLIMEVIDTISTSHNLTKIKSLIFIIIIFSLLEIITKLFSDYIFSLIGKKVVTKIKLDILQHLFTLDGKYITRLNVGDHINILDVDTRIVEQIGTETIFDLIRDILSSIFIIIMLISLQWDMVLFIIILQIIMIYLQVRFSKKMVLIRRKLRGLMGEITNLEQEMLGAFMNIMQLNAKNFVIKKIEDKQNKYVKELLKFQWFNGLNLSRISFIDVVTLSYILICGFYKISYGSLTIGGLITFLNYAQRISMPIQSIIRSNLQIQQAIISLEKIFEIIDTKGLDISNQNTIKSNKCEIAINNVEFYYDGGKKLKYNNMFFYPNCIHAIIGKSGIGKSTLIKLLYRLWDVDKGSIWINGMDIKEINIHHIRDKMGIVCQNTFMFNDTIINNLTLGNKQIESEFVHYICKKLKIHDDIIKLPDNYNTILGDRGINLSGGQLQRLSIARMLIARPSIIVMDEPTSALDEVLEKDIWCELQQLLKQSTTIIITHRKEILRYVDYVYDLNNTISNYN